MRKIPIKKDTRVYLFNGELKKNQEAQYAVLDIPVGDKDLQQCADALSPWYEVKTDNSFIYTPEWTFKPGQLRRW